MGVKGKMLCVAHSKYLEVQCKSSMFSVEQGVAQGCSLSPISFSVIC